MLPQPTVEPRGSRENLIVLLHAYMLDPESMEPIAQRVREDPQFANADLYTPKLPSWWVLSFSDPCAIARDLLVAIDTLWKDRNYTNIFILGHSLGALLGRKVYVLARGESDQAPFEEACRPAPLVTGSPGSKSKLEPRAWMSNVRRLILLAGMNRGWRINHHLSFKNAILWSAGTAFLYLLLGALRLIQGMVALTHRVFGVGAHRRWDVGEPIILSIRKGSPFITNLRLQWLAMPPLCDSPLVSEQKKNGQDPFLTIQLLGTKDDYVAPEDNIDLVSGGEFVYLDVPYSGHKDVIETADPQFGEGRWEVIRDACTRSEQDLRAQSSIPSNELLPQKRNDVTDVIFVMHGIRDQGYWTHKIARRVMKYANKQNEGKPQSARTVYAPETSSYGFFPMLPFLLPWLRHQKVEWLMDQYTGVKALYPNAQFSFIGHSNGTYLLARALRDYPCCRFQRVVFAGSVVRTNYEWRDFKQKGQVESVWNFAADGDWVVAWFPKLFQFLPIQDLGSAGHDGFDGFHAMDPGHSRRAPEGESFFQTCYVRGGHGAAKEEENWDNIARFIVDGKPVLPEAERTRFPTARVSWIEAFGKYPIVVWIFIAAVAYGGGCLILWMFSAGEEWEKTSLLWIYGIALWSIVTRL